MYLMWPESKEDLANRMLAVNARAEAHGRTIDYGLRVHMIVRDTEAEARSLPANWFQSWMMTQEVQSVTAPLIAALLACRDKRATGILPIWKVSLNRISGLG